MEKVLFIITSFLVLVVMFGVVNAQQDDNEYTRRHILSHLNLDDSATVKDVCNGFQEVLTSELDNQRKHGQSGILPPDDPNHTWINECKRLNVTMDSLLNLLRKPVNDKAAMTFEI